MPLRARGAVLEEIGRSRPFGDSRPLTISDIELEPPGHNELLIEIEAAGVCHSDLSVVDGNRPRPVPMLLGHEASGIVADAGPGCDADLVGRRVVLTFLPRCERCAACATEGRLPCERGSGANAAGTLLDGSVRIHRGEEQVLHHLGVSGFATHAVVDRRSAIVVQDEVPPEIGAVLGCAVLTGGGAVLNAGGLQAGQTVVVVGLGGVGVAALMVAIASGAGTVIAVDPLGHKRDHALRLGADQAYRPEEAVADELRGDLIIEAAGNTDAFETACQLIGVGGRLVTTGLPHPEKRARLTPLQLTAGAQTIVGSYLGSSVPVRDIPRYVQMWKAGQLPLEELISSEISLSTINTALDRLADGEELRQVIRPQN